MSPTKRRKPNGTTGDPGLMLADRYRLEEPVAAGGMGEVWRATDTLLQRSVAVKLLRASLAEDRVVSERFRREALHAAQMSHPNMAGIYDYVQDDGHRGIVMEFVAGETLADRLARERALSPGDAVRIASGVLSALQAAHDAGIIHRDVKPGNVMLTTSGEVKVTDFGIARAITDTTLTETGMVVGTAHYLSPEQVNGKSATPASDIYSLGAILYEMLSGVKPFQAETPLAVAMRRLTDDPRPLREVRKDIPEPLAQVVARALSRDPDARYASAAGMKLALDGALAAVQPATVPHKIDPDPTQVLPIEEIEPAGAATTVQYARPAREPRLSDRTGAAPAPPVAQRRRREYKRLVLDALLLAIGIGVAVFLLLALTGGDGTVRVPHFIGLTRAEAQAEADRVDLKLAFREEPSDEPRGTVLDQDPRSGALLARGNTITLTLSSGGVTIPPLKGMEKGDAKDLLEKQLGLKVEVTEQPSEEVQEGEVIGTIPPAGQTVEPGGRVDMVVSSGSPDEDGPGRGNPKRKGDGDS
jgi:serine/threonine-protein kinase